MKTNLYTIAFLIIIGCSERSSEAMSDVVKEEVEAPTVAEQLKVLNDAGYQTFTYVDPDTRDSIVMQQYFMVFLKRGPNRLQDAAAIDSLQAMHLAHLSRMYNEGYADISGPMGSDGDLRGITIYNTPTLEIADSLARLDPMVQSGRLEIEVHPWWAAKGFPLR